VHRQSQRSMNTRGIRRSRSAFRVRQKFGNELYRSFSMSELSRASAR
jgi:hypothetical protein